MQRGVHLPASGQPWKHTAEVGVILPCSCFWALYQRGKLGPLPITPVKLLWLQIHPPCYEGSCIPQRMQQHFFVHHSKLLKHSSCKAASQHL